MDTSQFLFQIAHNSVMIEKIKSGGTYMKYMIQAGIIATICFIGELLHFFIPLPVPASVYGMVILFVLLCLKVIKLPHARPQVEEVADWLLSIMPIFFIAPSVGLIKSFDSIKGQVLPLIFICFISTILVTALTGLIAQGVIYLQKKKKGGKENE